jgi:hypothetical protein
MKSLTRPRDVSANTPPRVFLVTVVERAGRTRLSETAEPQDRGRSYTLFG